MADWKFTDDYETDYPALENSILSLLVFSQHSINGTIFTGTLDVAATGVALRVISLIVDLQSIDVAGTVTESNDTLTVEFTSTNAQAFIDGVSQTIPLLEYPVTQAASMSIKTVTDQAQTSEDIPTTDDYLLNVTMQIGSSQVDVASTIPMNGGFFSLTGVFTGVGIQLSDLNFLMGSLATGEAWFPSQELGPYDEGTPSYGLLSMGLTGFVILEPDFSIVMSSVTVMVGISQLSIFDVKMYLDPLGVWVTVNDPVNNANVQWGLSGTVKLLNYNNQGLGGLSAPDFTFDFDMGFPTPDEQNFAFSSYLGNPDSNPVNLMLQDLMGQSTDVGLSDSLTINSFTLDSTANINTGEISDFSTSINMSGGFGLFTSFDLEEIAIDVTFEGS